MTTAWLDAIPIWAVLPATTALLAFSMEAGYRFGVWRHRRQPDEKEMPVGAMVASILGLLALVLGFTFSLAASRFEARRQVVLEEANAIGTTYLRAAFLGERDSTTVRRLLRDYVDVRLEGAAKGDATEILARSDDLHRQLWAEAVKAEKAAPNSIANGLFVQSLNGVIDLHAKRVMVGLRSRIPAVIWFGLIGLATLGMASVGYQAGLAATRRSPAMLSLIFAFGAVLSLIADLDRGGEGLLRVSQQALIDARASMDESPDGD
jgi:hypothetical protein